MTSFLRDSRTQKAIRFTANAVCSLAINYCVTIVMHELLQIREQISYGAALIVVFFFNFFMCRNFVYKANEGCVKRQMTGYLISSVIFRCGEFVAFWLINGIIGLWYIVAILVVQGASFIVKFFWYNYMFAKIGRHEREQHS